MRLDFWRILGTANRDLDVILDVRFSVGRIKNKSDKLCETITDQLRARVFISCGQAKGTDEVIVANSIASAKVAKNG